MGWIDRLAQRLGYSKTQTVQNPAPWMASYASVEQYNLPDGSIYAAQADMFRKLSWVATSVQILAESCATVQFSVMEMIGEDMVDIKNHPFEKLLMRPNPLMSRSEFLEAWFSFRILTGNGYIWLNRASESEPPMEMWVIPSNVIKPVPDGRLYLKGYVFNAGGEEFALKPWEIVHLKRFNPNNLFVGLSPVEAIAKTANMDLAKVDRELRMNGTDNGRMPGILAFGDNYSDSEWARMQRDIDDKANKMRAYLMMRNTKQGGVQWIQTSMSAEDMQFIESRMFTKEEIYGIFAPGLASMLAINATEANAKSGKATFAEFAQWPLLESAAQKITNDVLPAYGDDLVGMFDEVRQKDKAMVLQEIATFSQTHTVAEVRKFFYNDAPLGDERDALFPGQVGPLVQQPQVWQPEAAPASVPAEVPGEQVSGGTPDTPMDEETPIPVTDEFAEMNADLKRWKTVALHALERGKKPRTDFESEVIPLSLSGAISGALEDAATNAEVNRIFMDALTWRGYP